MNLISKRHPSGKVQTALSRFGARPLTCAESCCTPLQTCLSGVSHPCKLNAHCLLLCCPGLCSAGLTFPKHSFLLKRLPLGLFIGLNACYRNLGKDLSSMWIGENGFPCDTHILTTFFSFTCLVQIKSWKPTGRVLLFRSSESERSKTEKPKPPVREKPSQREIEAPITPQLRSKSCSSSFSAAQRQGALSCAAFPASKQPPSSPRAYYLPSPPPAFRAKKNC